VQREGSNVLVFEMERVVHEAVFFLNKLPFCIIPALGEVISILKMALIINTASFRNKLSRSLIRKER